MEHRAPYETKSLETCIRRRHSIRVFREDDVEERLLRECVALAQLAPSNSNMQNWRLTLALGEARKRVVTALRTEAEVKGPKVPPLPEAFAHFRSEFGHKLYGEEGYNIGREEKERHRQATLRNYEFFGAPVCGVISMHHDLTNVDALSVGMFVQTFVLALTERGLGACLQVSVTGYPEILRREFRLPDDQKILCGIAIGYPAVDHKVNNLVMTREDVEKQVTFHKD